MRTETHDIAVEAAKGTPALAGAIAASMTLNEWIAVATGIYILIQSLYLLRKWWREEKAWARREEAAFSDDLDTRGERAWVAKTRAEEDLS